MTWMPWSRMKKLQMMLSGKICTRWIVREKNYDCFLLVTGVYIYTNILSYCYTISLFYMVHSFLFWTLKVFTSTRKKDTYLTSGSPCFGEPTNLPPQKVLLGSLRLLKDTSRSAFFLNCTTLFSGGLQRQALRQTLRKLRFLNQVLGIWAI